MNTQEIENIMQAETGEAGAFFRNYIKQAVVGALREIVEMEVAQLCGPKYQPLDGGDYQRAGSAPGSVYLMGEKTRFDRPRVRERDDDGSTTEVRLKTLEAAKDPVEWEELMIRGVLCGVSTRNQSALHPNQYNGMSATKISRLWKEKSAVLIEEINGASLKDFKLVALWMDGTVLAKELHAVVAMGLDTGGHKRVLGFVIGSSENKEVCTDLVNSLVRRGLTCHCRRPLVVLDGADALKAAILSVWAGAVVQRCVVHKERNLYGYLQHRHHGKLKGYFKRLRQAQGKEAAREVLDELEAWLEGVNAQALESLREAGGELMGLHALGVPSTLNKSLLSTNNIENVMLNLKRHLGRVKRWRRETDIAERWVASGLAIAGKGFRRIKHYGELPHLVAALNASNETEAE